MGDLMEILLATGNKGKAKEIKGILEPLGFLFLTLADFPEVPAPEETGATFAENALIKARYYSQKFGITALADDSGLEVNYLGGGPGIFTARLAGPDATDAERNEKLLSMLQGVSFPERKASFVCVAALVYPDGREITTRGELSGYITTRPIGNEGFGFDPVFFLTEYEKTLAQLGKQKNKISHRYKAFKKMGEVISREKS